MKNSSNHLATIFTAVLVVSGAGTALAQTIVVPPTISIYAGSGTPGYTGDNGPASQAEVNPTGVAADSSGNLYFTDGTSANGYAVRKITTGQIISTVAGGIGAFNFDLMQYPPGPALGFPLYGPDGITIANGNIYFNDAGLYMVNPAGTLTPDYVNTDISNLVSDSSGNIYGIVNRTAIVKYNPGLPPTIIAGTTNFNVVPVTGGDGGPALKATFAEADSLAVDSAGNIYVSDGSDNIVRKFAPGGNINTIAGNPNLLPPAHGTQGNGGPATQAPLVMSGGALFNGTLAVDSKGNLYIAELTNDIRVVNSAGIIQTYAGNGSSGNFLPGPNGAALQSVINPTAIAVDSSDNLFLVNRSNTQTLILKITPQTTTTGGGGGSGPSILGVASAAASVISVTPGAFASIYGTNFAAAGVSQGWAAGDFVDNALPTTLADVSVTIDGKPAGVSFVNPGQINVVVPDDTATGPVNVVVTNTSGSSTPFSVQMTAASPAFFTLDGTHVIAQSFPSYSLVAPTTFGTGAPAAAGSTVIIYGTGFGPTTPPTPSNVLVATQEPLANTVTITIGGIPATFLYGGINSIGLDQLNVTLPPGLTSGDQPIVATMTISGSTVTTQSGAVIPIQ